MWKKSHMELESYPYRNRTSTAKYKQKVGEGLGKTKVVASTDVKKVKEGTTLGFHWIKDKYHKTIQKNQQSSYVFLSLRKTRVTLGIFSISDFAIFWNSSLRDSISICGIES